MSVSSSSFFALCELRWSEEHCKQGTDYVIGFSLKGLHKIEVDLFFPWMREKLTSVDKEDLSDAFATVMDQLESDRQKVEQLGDSIVSRFVVSMLKEIILILYSLI
jgi:hypothetical protein